MRNARLSGRRTLLHTLLTPLFILPLTLSAETQQERTFTLDAWVGETDTELTFSEEAEGLELYRSSEESCDTENYGACADGQMDVIGAQPITDTAFTTEQVAYYTYENATESEETMLSTEIFNERYLHEMVHFNDRVWVVAGYDSRDVRNDVWSSADGTRCPRYIRCHYIRQSATGGH